MQIGKQIAGQINVQKTASTFPNPMPAHFPAEKQENIPVHLLYSVQQIYVGV